MKFENELKKGVEGLKAIKGDNKIVFESKNGYLKVMVSSQNCFGVFNAPMTENINVTVNFEHLLKILSVTKEPEMSVKDNMVYISEEGSEFCLPVATTMVNKIQGKGNPVTLKFTNEAYDSLCKHTSFAVAKDDSRPVFKASSNGEVCAYASNMHKLATIKVVADVSGGNIDVVKILPKEALNLKPEGDVTMIVYDNLVSVSYDGFEFLFPLIEGVAPNYDAVIPTTNVEMTVSKNDLLQEVQKTLLASFGVDMCPVQIYFRNDKIEVYSESNEFGKIRGSIKAMIPANLQGKRIAFNGEYLGELKHFDADTLTLATVVKGDSIELSPMKFTNAEEEYTFVVTPVRMKAWSLDA